MFSISTIFTNICKYLFEYSYSNYVGAPFGVSGDTLELGMRGWRFLELVGMSHCDSTLAQNRYVFRDYSVLMHVYK